MNKDSLNHVTVISKTDAGFNIELVYNGESIMVTIPEAGIIEGMRCIRFYKLNDSSRVEISLESDGLFVVLKDIPEVFWCANPHPTKNIYINKIITNVGYVKQQLQRFGL